MSYYPRFTNFVDGTVSFNNYVVSPKCGPLTYDYVPAKPDLTLRVWNPDFESYESPKPPRDTSSFTQIKRSGSIKMTPLYRSRRTVRCFVVGVPVYTFSLGWPACSTDNTYGPQVKATSSYIENHVINEPGLGDRTIPSGAAVPDLQSELNSLRSNVVKANLSTYDILTDLGEVKETAELIMSLVKAVRHPLESFINFRKSLLNDKGISPLKVKKMLEDKWMEYRYGIMPLYYSVRDAAKLLEERNNVYKADRSQKLFNYTLGAKPPSLEGIYSYSIEEVSIRLSCVAKASYNPNELYLRLFDQVGFNPFVTAWELIPYSFVIDWFANVGDWVLAHTASATDGAQQRVFCDSVKEIRVKKTYLSADITYKAERAYSAGTVVAGPFRVIVDELLCEARSETYSRSLFVPADIQLRSDIFLNWKRMIDAWVLGQRPVINGLRRLRNG